MAMLPMYDEEKTRSSAKSITRAYSALGRKRGDGRFEDGRGIAQRVEAVAEVLQHPLNYRRRIKHLTN
jgi:hypothetical protein